MAGAEPGPSGRPRGRPGDRLFDGLGLLGGLVLALITAAIFLQVVLRYAFRTGIEGLEEVPRYLFVWLVMIGAAAAMHRGEHTALDYFVARLGPRGRAAARVVTTATGMALFVSLIRSSVVLVPNAQLQTSPGLGLPLGWVFAAVPVGAALILIPMARDLGTALRELWRKRS
ncbi:MAG TPA: TRAP transporter small permease [Candidatus Binatia bacterium]|nr:TRAP transporter small permease [Candidatus Binatia bacterium]